MINSAMRILKSCSASATDLSACSGAIALISPANCAMREGGIDDFAEQSSLLALNASIDVRRYDAADTDMPNPVPIATYAATHIGHLGISASTDAGTIHPATPRHRRATPRVLHDLQEGPGLLDAHGDRCRRSADRR